MEAQAAVRPGHWGKVEEHARRARIPSVTAACPARPSRASGSGVLAARALAWLLLWAAWLVGRLTADFSDAPFSAGKGQGAERACAELGRRWGAPAAPVVPEAGFFVFPRRDWPRCDLSTKQVQPTTKYLGMLMVPLEMLCAA